MAAKTREFSNHMVDEDPRGQGFKGLSRDHPRDSPPAEREASGCPPRRGGARFVGGSGFSPLSRAEHRHDGRNQRADLSDPAERRGSFRARRPYQPVAEARVMLSGKAASEAKRAAIDRL